MTPPRRDWSGLAPLQRTVGAPPLTAGGDTFASTLASRSARPLVQPLTHGVLRDAPTGQLRGIARPSDGVPLPVAQPQPELPLRERASVSEPAGGDLVGEEVPAQRAVRPGHAPLTSAPRIDAPGRRVRAVPPVQRRAAGAAADTGGPAPVVSVTDAPSGGEDAPAAAAAEATEVGAGSEPAVAPPTDGALPLATHDADAGATARVQRAAVDGATGTPTAQAPLAATAAAQPVEAETHTLAAGSSGARAATVTDRSAAAATPAGGTPSTSATPAPDPLPVARLADTAPSPLRAGARDPSLPPTSPPPAVTDTRVQRTGSAAEGRPPRRVGLGEPLVAPVRRSAMQGPSPVQRREMQNPSPVQRAAAPSTSPADPPASPAAPPASPPAPPADAAPPPAVAGWDAGESPPSDDGEVADDAPLIGGRVAATSLGLGADAPASSPATGAADHGDRADLPLQHPEAAVPLQRSATAAAGPSAAAPIRQVARGADTHAPDSAPTAPSPGPAAPSDAGRAAASAPVAATPAAAPLIGDRAPATRLGGEQDVPAPPVAPQESAAAAAHPRREPEGELPLQRQPAAATAQAAGGPAHAPAAGAGAPTTRVATVSAMPDVVTGESTSFAPSPDVPPVSGGAPDTSRPALDESPALVPNGAPTMASAPLLPHRPALLQRTLESHAAAGAPAPGSGGSPSQEAARPAPMSATAPTPRSGPSVQGGRGGAGRPAGSSVARPPQQVQPLRRVVAGAPASVAPSAPGSTATPPASGPSALLAGPPVDDGFGPMTAITDVRAGPSATAPLTAQTELGSVAEAVALHAPAMSWGTSGTAIGTPQAVQTLAAGAPALAAPSALRPTGGTAASGPSAVQRASAQPQGSATGQPMAPFTSWPAPADAGGHLDLAVPPVPASFAATAGPVEGSALTTAVQRDLTVHAPPAEPAAPPAQIQREEAPPVTAAPAPPTATAVPDPAAASAGRGGPQTEEELDVLAGRLYDHIAGRLRHELRMDRERTGLLNDLH